MTHRSLHHVLILLIVFISAVGQGGATHSCEQKLRAASALARSVPAPYPYESDDKNLSQVRIANPVMNPEYIQFLQTLPNTLGSSLFSSAAGFDLTAQELAQYPQFAEIGMSGKFFIPLVGDATTFIQPGDVILSFRQFPKKPKSQNEVAALASGGSGHAALVTPLGSEGGIAHQDSPPEASGVEFQPPLHIFRLRSNYVSPTGLSRKEILERTFSFSKNIEGHYKYDDDFSLDIAHETPEAFAASIENGETRLLYCSELPFVIFRVAGVDLTPEGTLALAQGVEQSLEAAGISERKKAKIRAALIQAISKFSESLPLTKEVTSGQVPLDRWFASLDPATQKDIDDQYPLIAPGFFTREAVKNDGAFSYVGTYVGRLGN